MVGTGVISSKPHQENLLRKNYRWRLCVYYLKLNQDNRPFNFHIPRCNGIVQDIDKEYKYFIKVDRYGDYWQVVTE